MSQELTTFTSRKEEAQYQLSRLRGAEETQKDALLEIHARKLYKEIGYDTFEAFAEDYFGVTRQHMYRLLEVARVERNLAPMQDQFRALPNQAGALLLARLPEPELQRSAWEQMDAITRDAVRTPRQYQTEFASSSLVCCWCRT